VPAYPKCLQLWARTPHPINRAKSRRIRGSLDQPCQTYMWRKDQHRRSMQVRAGSGQGAMPIAWRCGWLWGALRREKRPMAARQIQRRNAGSADCRCSAAPNGRRRVGGGDSYLGLARDLR
jgi:hypothetical protein